MSNFRRRLMGVQQHGGLPAGYQEVEYIGSTGTQWIDTGVKLSNNSNVEINAKFTATVKRKSYYLFGSSLDQKRYMIAVGSTTDKYLADFKNSSYRINSSVSAFDSIFHIHKINNLNYYIDNILQGSQTSLNFSNTESAYLFDVRGRSTDSSVGIQAWEVKYCRIYDNGTLVRNFVPCYRKSDNVVGMFDTAEGKFYTNQGTGAFYIPSLPSEYQQVEYIGSNGTQYIDLGRTVSDSNKAYVDYSWSSKQYGAIFGAQAMQQGFTINVADMAASRFGTYTYMAFPDTRYKKGVNTKYNITYSKDGFYQDGTLLATPTYNEFQTTINAYLFKANGASSVGNLKIYNFKLYEDNDLKMDLVPCYRKFDGEIGMYDTVNKVFYTNAGSGEFLYE